MQCHDRGGVYFLVRTRSVRVDCYKAVCELKIFANELVRVSYSTELKNDAVDSDSNNNLLIKCRDIGSVDVYGV